MALVRLRTKDDRPPRATDVDIPFLVLVLLLLGVGLTMLYSASYAQSEYDTGYTMSTKYLQKQGVCALLGLVCMWAFSRVPAQVWQKLAWPIYGGSIVLLLSVLVVGESVNGARRWINIAGIQFQPSELAKFSMILLLARLTRKFGTSAKEFRYGVLGFGFAMLGLLVPLALEKHLSAIMLMGMVGVVMMFVAGTSPKWLLAGAGAAAVFVLIYITFMGYAGDRVTAWLHPEQDPGDTGYQILQSLYAIGSGGLFGLGLGKSKQKYLYLPFQYNDYIFAIVCGTGAHRRGADYCLVCRHHRPGLLDRPAGCRSVFYCAGSGTYQPHCRADSAEPGSCYQFAAVYRHCAALFLLRRHGFGCEFGRDGDSSEHIPPSK